MWLGGWPRGHRIYRNATALDIIVRQPRLNQPPGTYFSYTNSGYILVLYRIHWRNRATREIWTPAVPGPALW